MLRIAAVKAHESPLCTKAITAVLRRRRTGDVPGARFPQVSH